MSASVAIAGVDARIGQIRSRIAALAGSSASNTNGASGAVGVSGTAAAFDPFGAAYQQALAQSGGAPSPPSADSIGFSSGASADTSTRMENVATRVPWRATRTPTDGPVNSPASTSTSTSGGALSGTDVARMAYGAGFRGKDLVDVVAISKRESNWRPGAFNGNADTGDRSYGLMQINMLGDLGPARLQQFGLTSNEQLLDPQTNLNAAFTLYQRSAGTLSPWGGYKGLPNTFSTNVDGAHQIVADAGLLGA